MGLRLWTRALNAFSQFLSSAEAYKWPDKYPASAWLRRDIGLGEEVVMRERDRIDEIRRRYSGWV
ncbi:hypothetical protein RAD16_29075 [Bradyrhizobium sp. 18BD]